MLQVLGDNFKLLLREQGGKMKDGGSHNIFFLETGTRGDTVE